MIDMGRVMKISALFWSMIDCNAKDDANDQCEMHVHVQVPISIST